MQTIRYTRTDAHNPDFQGLVRLLDAHLTSINGDDDTYYAQFNGIQHLHHVVVAYSNDAPVGCGAFKEFRDEQHPHGTVEIKRMYVKENERGRGIAQGILEELERWAREEDYTSSVLETSSHLASAVKLYEKSGYERIPNYGQYVGMEMSVCMIKVLV